jgi:ATP-dependent Clp protease adapter protein ClpS
MVTAAVMMLEAHLRGIAQMIACPKEQAGLYCEWPSSFGLTATLEPAG